MLKKPVLPNQTTFGGPNYADNSSSSFVDLRRLLDILFTEWLKTLELLFNFVVIKTAKDAMCHSSHLEWAVNERMFLFNFGLHFMVRQR